MLVYTVCMYIHMTNIQLWSLLCVYQEYEDRRPLRIGFLVDDGYFTPVPACQRAVRVAKGVLEQQGHEVCVCGVSDTVGV